MEFFEIFGLIFKWVIIAPLLFILSLPVILIVAFFIKKPYFKAVIYLLGKTFGFIFDFLDSFGD